MSDVVDKCKCGEPLPVHFAGIADHRFSHVCLCSRIWKVQDKKFVHTGKSGLRSLTLFDPGPELRLRLHVTVGLYGSIAVTEAESTEPGFWDNEVSNVGTIHPDDLGIAHIPSEPGKYVWEGTLKTWGPDMEGDYDAEYQGSWAEQ